MKRAMHRAHHIVDFAEKRTLTFVAVDVIFRDFRIRPIVKITCCMFEQLSVLKTICRIV